MALKSRAPLTQDDTPIEDDPNAEPAPAPADDGVKSHLPSNEKRVVDPVDAAAMPPAVPTPEPVTQTSNTLTPGDIAGVVTQTQAPAPYVAPDIAGAERYGGGGAPAAPAALSPQDAEMSALLHQRLIDLMGRSTVPSENDPEIAKTLQATRAAGQRGFDRNAADLAERAAYAGQSNSGSAEAGRAALRSAQAETEQQVTAQVYTDAANRRVAELQQTLQLSGNLLNEKEKNALQLQIAQLQDATDRLQIGEGGRQFDTGLAEKIREYGLDALYRDASLGASSAASGAALDQRKYEFDKNYGLDVRDQDFKEASWTKGLDTTTLEWLARNFPNGIPGVPGNG